MGLLARTPHWSPPADPWGRLATADPATLLDYGWRLPDVRLLPLAFAVPPADADWTDWRWGVAWQDRDSIPSARGVVRSAGPQGDPPEVGTLSEVRAAMMSQSAACRAVEHRLKRRLLALQHLHGP